jgi:hypothetical protein
VDAYNFFKDKAGNLGLVVNHTKTHMLSSSPPQEPFDFNFSDTGITILGAPIGLDSFMKDKVATYVDKLSQCLSKIKDYSCDIGYTLIRVCVSAMPYFLFKSVFPTLTDLESSLLDLRMRETLGRLVGKRIIGDDLATSIASLPLRFGGLGVRSVWETRSVSWAISFLRSFRRIKDDLPEFLVDNDALLLNEYANFINPLFPSLNISNVQSLYVAEDRMPTVKDTLEVFYTQKKKDLLSSLFTEPIVLNDVAKAHLLNSIGSGDKGVNEWIASVFNRSKYTMSAHEYREALRLRLAFGCTDINRRCSCRNHASLNITPTSDSFHPLVCNAVIGTADARHEACKEPIREFIKACRPGSQVHFEPHIGHHANNRADVQVLLPTETDYKFFDICVACPTATSYLNLSYNKLSKEAACKKVIGAKTNKYKRINGVARNNPLSSQYVFFALDATGRLSKNAMEFVDFISFKNTENYVANAAFKEARKALFMKLSVICARWIGRTLCAWRGRVAIAADAPTLLDFPTHDLHDVHPRDLEPLDDGRPSQISLPDDLTQVFAPLPVPPAPT